MMVAKDLREVASDAGYPLEAFLFVQRGLDHTVRSIHGELEDDAELEDTLDPQSGQSNRHVSGHDLCYGLRDYAVEEYGLMARSVLRRWRIVTCEDFGRIVFAMVESGMMQKTDDDTIADFQGVFNFAEAFANDLLLTE